MRFLFFHITAMLCVGVTVSAVEHADDLKRLAGFASLALFGTSAYGVVQRIQQRAARPAENGIRPGGAATVHPDVASMTRAQREALERRVLHGAQIEL